jgi:hypothetical protein
MDAIAGRDGRELRAGHGGRFPGPKLQKDSNGNLSHEIQIVILIAVYFAYSH